MKRITEKELIIKQYRNVRDLSIPKESKEITELDNQIRELIKQRDNLKTNEYQIHRKETETKILDFLNNKMQVLE